MGFDQEMFGMRIQRVRKLNSMTQQELAIELGIDCQHMSRLERGVRSCSLETLIKLSQVLNMSADYFLTGKESNKDLVKKELFAVMDQLEMVVQNL